MQINPLGTPEDSETDFQLPTEQWLVEGFEKGLEKIKPGFIASAQAESHDANEAQPGSDSVRQERTSDYENAIIELASLRDWLIGLFVKEPIEKSTQETIETVIHKVEDIIKSLGGEVEIFDPIDLMSGLEAIQTPALEKESLMLSNANVAVENTKRHYKMHKIASIGSKIIRGSPAIVFKIEGIEAQKPFSVVGAVVAKTNFAGNEAIDYVRHNGKGALGVKALSENGWVDVSGAFHLAAEDR